MWIFFINGHYKVGGELWKLSILILKASFSYQWEELKKWYNEVKDLSKYIQKLENKTTEIGEQ